MFTIVIPVEDLTANGIFKDRQFSEYDLARELTEYYTYGPYRPQVRLEQGLAIIEVDAELIERDEEKYRKAVELCEKGRFDKAAPMLKKLVADAPAVSEYNRLYGQVLSEQGNLPEALRYLNEAVKWDYSNHWAFIMLGNIHMRQLHDEKAALGYYNRALAIDPANNILLNNLGAYYAHQGDYGKALEYFSKALEADSEYPNTHYGIALADYHGERFTEAFDGACRCLRLCKAKDGLYESAYELAREAAFRLISQGGFDLEAEIKDIELKTGKKITVEKDGSISTAAKVEVAETHGRDYHRVIYNPKLPAYQHLVMHELMHLVLAARARENGRNELFLHTGEMREAFIRENSQTAYKLARDGIREKQISEYLSGIFEGINSQVYNTNIDLIIEQELYNNYPALRPYQFISQISIVQSGVDACTGKKAVAYTPAKIMSASRILNTMLALQLEDMYGVKMADAIPNDINGRSKARQLYDAYLKARDTLRPGDEYAMVKDTARQLRLEKYHRCIPEDEADQYRKKPESKKEREAPAGQLNMAVVMYLVSAINTLYKMDREKVRQIAYEIADKGRNGINTQSTELDQTLESLPGKAFTGLQLTAWMYAAWQFVEPSLDTGLDYEGEFAAAMKMAEIMTDDING